MTELPDWVGLLERLTLAGSTGRWLGPVDIATVAQAFLRSVETGRSLEHSLGLPPQWRSMWRLRQRTACVYILASRKVKGRAAAENLHAELTRYRSSSRWKSDLAGKTQPTDDDFFRHSILRNNNDRVPSAASIRRMLGSISRDGI